MRVERKLQQEILHIRADIRCPDFVRDLSIKERRRRLK
jgi:hypothetical protein